MALRRIALMIGLALLAALATASSAAALNRTATLVSKPTGVADPDSGDAAFVGNSRDGSRVIFSTLEKLTPDDQDTGRVDVYERSGGITRLLSKPSGTAD